MDEFLSKIRAQDPLLYKKLRLIATTFEDISSTAPDLSAEFMEFLYKKYSLLSALTDAVERLSLEGPVAKPPTSNDWDLSKNASAVEPATDMNNQHPGFVYEPHTGLYYDYKLQCHYIPTWRLYYFHQNMTYYTYDEASHTLKFYCHAAMNLAENSAYSTPYSGPHYEGEKLVKEMSAMRNDCGLPLSCGNESLRNPIDSFWRINIGGTNSSVESGVCSTIYPPFHYEREKPTKDRTLGAVTISDDSGLPPNRLRFPEDFFPELNFSAGNGAASSTSYSASHYEGEKRMEERTIIRNDSGLARGFGRGSHLRNPVHSMFHGGQNPLAAMSSAEIGASSMSYLAPHHEREKLTEERTVIRNDNGLPLGFGRGSHLRNPVHSMFPGGQNPLAAMSSAEIGACSTSYPAPHYELERLLKERSIIRNDSGLPLSFGRGSHLRNPVHSMCTGGQNPLAAMSSAEIGACSTSYSAPHYELERLLKERPIIRNDSGLPIGLGRGTRLRKPEDSMCIGGQNPSDEPVDSTCHKTLKEQHMDEIRTMKAKFGLLHPSDTKPPNKYVDRAENRRKQKKSSHPSEKTEMASPETPIDKGNKGFELLSKMGWVEGSPLGIRNDGITEPVMIKKRDSKRVGLGCEQQITEASKEAKKEARKASKKKQIAEITKKRFDAIE